MAVVELELSVSKLRKIEASQTVSIDESSEWDVNGSPCAWYRIEDADARMLPFVRVGIRTVGEATVANVSAPYDVEAGEDFYEDDRITVASHDTTRIVIKGEVTDHGDVARRAASLVLADARTSDTEEQA